MGQPDPRWAEAPEFNWIPDKPFRAECPAGANSNEPIPPEVAPKPEPIKPVTPSRRNFGLRQSLNRQTGKMLDHARDSAAYLNKLIQSRPRMPRPRVEPRFEFSALHDPVVETWKAGTEQGAALMRDMRASLARTADSTGRVFVEHGAALREGSAAAAKKAADFGADTAHSSRAALKRAAALATGLVAATGHGIAAIAAGLARGIAAIRTRLGVLAAGAVKLGVATAAHMAIFATASAAFLTAAGRSILVQISTPAEAAPSRLPLRLAVGTLQGIGLALLVSTQSLPAAAATMALLFAPLLFLASLGRMPARWLLIWTASAAIALAALGAYQYWRAPGEPPVAAMVMAALFLFIAQALLFASARESRLPAPYPTYVHIAWLWTAESAVWILCAAVAALCADGVGNLLRQAIPGMHLLMPVAPLATLAVACASWLLSPMMLRLPVRAFLALLTFLLPALALLGAAIVTAQALMNWQPPLLLVMAVAAGLVLGINASYGSGTDRARWRQISEFAAGILLVPLVLSAGLALHARVAALGWTAPRILTASALGLLAAYAASYFAAALISLGGGGWMQRLERANLAMAVTALALLAALLSPLADPARLAVHDQVGRLEAGLDPEAFDFAYLRDSTGRFGREALARLATRSDRLEIARGVYLALTANADTALPLPTQIGANIAVHGGALPASLLAQDWSKAAGPGVPPCLTHTGLRCEAFFADLDADGADEIILTYGTDAHWWAGVMKQGRDGWQVAGTLASACPGGLNALRAGRFAPVAALPGWRDLLAGGMRLTITPSGAAKKAGCAS
jgi:hypothetical protein